MAASDSNATQTGLSKLRELVADIFEKYRGKLQVTLIPEVQPMSLWWSDLYLLNLCCPLCGLHSETASPYLGQHCCLQRLFSCYQLYNLLLERHPLPSVLSKTSGQVLRGSHCAVFESFTLAIGHKHTRVGIMMAPHPNHIV